MKQRFSSLDVRVIVHELAHQLVSLRLANVYDLSSRIFLLKFAKPDHREQLLIDSGFRCHLTAFSRTTAAAPSAFVARLRKFIRTRRCTAVQQVGTDRVIEIQFSDGAYRLFLEFYAGGNVVLTDADLTVLALLRNVSEGAEHEQYRLGLKYDLSLRQNYGGVPPLTKERVREGLEKAVQRQAEEAKKPGKKIKKKSGDALRKALAVTTTEFPPILLDHALSVTGFDKETLPEQVIEDDGKLDSLMQSLHEAQRVIEEITSSENAKGYILAKPAKSGGEGKDGSNLLYDDFHPFKPQHLLTDQSVSALEFDGFNKTVDEFFSSLEGQKLESRLQEREDAAKRRIDQAREEQSKRIDGLQQVQELNIRKASAIEANVERVEEAVAAVNGLIAQGMDWVDIGRLIENEQSRQNPVAQLIKLPLKLHENTITLLLSESDAMNDDDMLDETDSEASDSEDENAVSAARPANKIEDKRLTVDVDLALSPWSNARQYYDQKRTAAVKQEKTAQASQKALKSTEQKVMADLKKGLKQEKDILRPVRRQMWFEKFNYFISSDGYLVLAGYDAQQNEILYRRYLKRGDVYLHADVHGAASVIVKNNPATPNAPIPPDTLTQAGQMAICTSSAWDSKAGFSAWWVNADQVSKTAPTGEYLTTGGFMIRGKKNFLHPAQLLLGFAIMFQISEESKARHVKHRHRDDAPPSTGAQNAGTMMQSSVVGDAAKEAEDSGSDDDFPDAHAAAADEDDDFPDAVGNDIDTAADDDEDGPHATADEDEDHAAQRSNPLQSNGHADSSDHSNDDDDAEADNGSDEDEGEPEDDTHHADSAEPVDNDSTAVPDHASQISDTTTSQTTTGKPAAKPTAQPKPTAPVRGKRGKAKKAAQKYANQDEEDRALAMALLGSQAATEKRDAEAAARAAKAESLEQARARRRAQHERAQQKGLEAEEIRRLNLEEGIEALDEDESASLTELDTLVGTPLPGDEILEAIAICAPWSALGKYKYKAKLQPGQQKQGKAVREVLGKWNKDGSDAKKVDGTSLDTERIWPREVELIKGLMVVVFLGVGRFKSVRIIMRGMGGGEKGGKGGGGGGGKRGGRGSKSR